MIRFNPCILTDLDSLSITVALVGLCELLMP